MFGSTILLGNPGISDENLANFFGSAATRRLVVKMLAMASTAFSAALAAAALAAAGAAALAARRLPVMSAGRVD
jgi:hypothetical protein